MEKKLVLTFLALFAIAHVQDAAGIRIKAHKSWYQGPVGEQMGFQFKMAKDKLFAQYKDKTGVAVYVDRQLLMGDTYMIVYAFTNDAGELKKFQDWEHEQSLYKSDLSPWKKEIPVTGDVTPTH